MRVKKNQTKFREYSYIIHGKSIINELYQFFRTAVNSQSGVKTPASGIFTGLLIS